MQSPPATLPTASAVGLHVHVQSSTPVRLNAEFDCAPGELIALVGASGSGKTTLLRTIAGLHRSSDLQGSVRLGDQLWMDTARGVFLPPQQRRAGLVFQHYALFPHLNAINNIALCADSAGAFGIKGSQKIALEWLERMGLADLGQRLPHELSGGQQQRVALARAAVRLQSDCGEHTAGDAHKSTRGKGNGNTRGKGNENTRGKGNGNTRGVLLLDEPFSAVDAPMRQVLYRELAQLRQSLNVPIVLVTHDLHEARRLADRIVIIDAGESLQSGPPATLMRSPRNARVAELVGIHNHFSAHFVKADRDHALLHWGDVKLRARDKGKIDSGTAVTWVLAGEAVQVSACPSAIAGDDANQLACTLTEMLPLGEISLCRLAVRGTQDVIQLNLPTAQLGSMGMHTGSSIWLSIPIHAAHIMPLRH